MAEAEAAGFSGTFRALVAHEGASAASRFDLSGEGWVRPDGVRVVADAAELESDTWLAPINVQADGTYLGNYAVWLGASRTDGAGSDSTCSDWTDDSSTEATWYFRASSSWAVTTGQIPCNASYARLFCLEN